jgi:hypothetical protein
VLETIASGDTGDARSNFPWHSNAERHRPFVAARQPATPLVFDTQVGRRIASIPLCGDSDDLFVDCQRRQLYVICGEGVVEVIGHAEADRYEVLLKRPYNCGLGIVRPGVQGRSV